MLPFKVIGISLSLFILLILGGIRSADAQSDPRQVGAVLGERILSPDVALFQLRKYLLNRVAEPPVASTIQSWNAESKRLRRHLLNEVVFHGWPEDWINAPPKFEVVEEMESGNGYRVLKLRYEIVPRFQSTAILYQPENPNGKVPAILNVNGHVGPPGKAIEYKQKRCINFAKRGILALNLEWLGMGELSQKENQHWFGAHLDLVGVNELGLFYLAMRKGLDYLYEHPQVDPNRLGLTGLSGGGWQTILLSSLDERVSVAVPVAGFSSFRPRIEARWYGDLGDVEQSATDLLAGQDYAHLTALRAPRPTLLIYNAEDDCCFRAPLVKPLVFDAIQPFFRLYGQEEAFAWHENTDPGTHNYLLDNRLQAYRFFSQHFGLPLIHGEIPVAAEIKSSDELRVGLPQDNLTILGLAQQIGRQITRPAVPSEAADRKRWSASEREKLKTLVRHKPVLLERPWSAANTKNRGLETKSYLFEMDNGLSANGVWFKAITSPRNAPVTLVLHDEGKSEAAVEVSDRVNRGEQVLALDLIYTGDAWHEISPADHGSDATRRVGPWAYGQMVHGIGDRSLGLQAAQLIAIAHWMQSQSGNPHVRVEVIGMRNQVAALIASALEPDLFSEITIHEGMQSLSYLLEKPVQFQDAPELFCLDLYKEFDLDRLTVLAEPTKVTTQKHIECESDRLHVHH